MGGGLELLWGIFTVGSYLTPHGEKIKVAAMKTVRIHWETTLNFSMVSQALVTPLMVYSLRSKVGSHLNTLGTQRVE